MKQYYIRHTDEEGKTSFWCDNIHEFISKNELDTSVLNVTLFTNIAKESLQARIDRAKADVMYCEDRAETLTEKLSKNDLSNSYYRDGSCTGVFESIEKMENDLRFTCWCLERRKSLLFRLEHSEIVELEIK